MHSNSFTWNWNDRKHREIQYRQKVLSFLKGDTIMLKNWVKTEYLEAPGYDHLDCVFTTKVNEFTNWLLTASASNRQWTHSASIRVSKYGLKRAILSSFSVLYKASDKRYQKLKVTSATWREEESTVQENSKVKKVLLASSLFLEGLEPQEMVVFTEALRILKYCKSFWLKYLTTEFCWWDSNNWVSNLQINAMSRKLLLTYHPVQCW